MVYGDYRIDEYSDANKKNDKIVYSGFTDYYPYGLAMDNRQYQGESYLFGFQGMEQESDQDETQYHTLFRQYDAVLGRWWSSDPEQKKL